jgi:TPR repeat protein
MACRANFNSLIELNNMTLLYKSINCIVIVIASMLLLAACTDKAAESNQAKTVVLPKTAVTEEMIAKLKKEADAGDPDAQYSLAYLYENGRGMPKNEAKALELYQQAADQGHSTAKHNLDAMSVVK